MDTEKQQWFCDICEKKYSLKRKNIHPQTIFHENNQARLNRAADFENYVTIQYRLLMERSGDMTLSKYLERSAEVYIRLKREFNQNYKVTE